MIGQALFFPPGDDGGSFFEAQRLPMLLKSSAKAFSVSMWIRPATVGASTLVHISNNPHGLVSVGNPYCMPLIGFSSTGQLIVQGLSEASNSVLLSGPDLKMNEWVHVVETYSSANGIRLHLNGTFINSTEPFSYLQNTDPIPITVILGAHVGCQPASDSLISGPYHGLIDEFRIYSRELTSTDIYKLANPFMIHTTTTRIPLTTITTTATTVLTTTTQPTTPYIATLTGD
ncbi:unnamed protein product [Didymodactylos carnosus]|nr:unnamed protein product [Didymodactylos carnosus]CAF3687603.1 unnamed protein product [Didymodactylos carnosus]